jgi:Metal-dependent amidase/aminoacylase/carboxypeptidase
MKSISLNIVRGHIAAAIDAEAQALRQLNHDIHSHPEIAYEEVYAHDTLTDFLGLRGWAVKRHAYGLQTSFEVETNTSEGGPVIVFCAEYDALPGIGHGCGHNLIATSSLAAFLGLAKAVREMGLAGRVRILGTPAEEGGGGRSSLSKRGRLKTLRSRQRSWLIRSRCVASPTVTKE